MAETEHGRIIASEAEAALAPAGFCRRGRSRVWLADRGYWLSVVEFQPSGFSKGSYCNVAVHWLWSLTPALTLAFGAHRVGGFVSWTGNDRFTAQIAIMSREAGQASERFRAMFPSLPETAAVLVREARARAVIRGWEVFNAGVACGLVGDSEAALQMFAAAIAADTRDLDWVRERSSTATRLAAALRDQDTFHAEVQALVDAQRQRFKLSPYPLPEQVNPWPIA